MSNSIDEAINYLVRRKFGLTAAIFPALAKISNVHSDITSTENKRIEEYTLTLRNMTETELLTLRKRSLEEDEEKKRQATIWEEQQRFYNLSDAIADVVHWSKAAFWSIDEAVAISFGKEPEVVSWKKIEGLKTKTTFAKNFAKRRDLVVRAIQAKKLSDPINPKNFVAWARETNIKLPDNLTNEIDKIGDVVLDWKAAYENLKTLYDSTDQKSISKPESTRKTENLLQAFAAIAIDAYGYDPEALKSNAPSDIAKALSEHGKEVDPKTIRSWLKEGKALLG